MRIFLFSLLVIGFAVVITPKPAAAEVYECGTPQDPHLETDPGFRYCDIHSRRFEYKDSRDKFKGQLDARRENYIAADKPARDAYQRQLEALHNQAGQYNE